MEQKPIYGNEIRPVAAYWSLGGLAALLLAVQWINEPLHLLPSDAIFAFFLIELMLCGFGLSLSAAYFLREREAVHRRSFLLFLGGTLLLTALALTTHMIEFQPVSDFLKFAGLFVFSVVLFAFLFVVAMNQHAKILARTDTQFNRLVQRIKVNERWADLLKTAFVGQEMVVLRGLSGKRRGLYLIALMLFMVTAMGMSMILNIEAVRVLGRSPFVFSLGFLGSLLLVAGPILLMGLFKLVYVEKQQAEIELKTAHDLQMSLMPAQDPSIPGFEISGACIPAHEVGGDFFDYLWLDTARKKLGIVIADVSGKAMKAAITAVMTSGMIYQETSTNGSPKNILRRINRPMYLKLDSRMFTALSFASIDTKKKELRFSNAGQTYPILKRGTRVLPLEVKGARLPLGVKEDVPYGELVVKLKKGDTVIFYTDGIPEAKNEEDEFYGFERFKALAGTSDGLSATELRDRILNDVKSFTAASPQYDDMTVVVVKVE